MNYRWLLAGLLFLAMVNYYFRRKTFQSLDRAWRKKQWKNISNNLSDKEYVKRCYDFVADRYTYLKDCWIKRPWRNFYFGDYWNLKGKSVPCLIQNDLFQRCLLKKFDKSRVKTIFTTYPRKLIFIHFHSKVYLDGKWVDVDVHGKKNKVPFGKQLCNTV